MKIFRVDTDALKITGPAGDPATPRIWIKRGDKTAIAATFHVADTPLPLDTAAVRYAIKSAAGGAMLAYATCATAEASGDLSIWPATLDLGGLELATALGLGGTEKASIPALLEISWVSESGEETSARNAAITIENDLARPEEPPVALYPPVSSETPVAGRLAKWTGADALVVTGLSAPTSSLIDGIYEYMGLDTAGKPWWRTGTAEWNSEGPVYITGGGNVISLYGDWTIWVSGMPLVTTSGTEPVPQHPADAPFWTVDIIGQIVGASVARLSGLHGYLLPAPLPEAAAISTVYALPPVPVFADADAATAAGITAGDCWWDASIQKLRAALA